MNETEFTCTPPTVFIRNQHGLICSPDIKYVYKPDGRVDWRAMIPREFIVPNQQRTKETDISKLNDKDLLILLFGFRALAEIRGYDSISYSPISPTPSSVIVACHINWIPNYETEGRAVTSGSVGDATPENTTGFGKSYLSPIAENRAFIRAVRNFLRISVAGFEEINPIFTNQEQTAEKYVKSIDPRAILKEVMDEKGVSFDRLKIQLVADNFDGASDIKSLEDIANWKIVEMTGRLKKLKA